RLKRLDQSRYDEEMAPQNQKQHCAKNIKRLARDGARRVELGIEDFAEANAGLLIDELPCQLQRCQNGAGANPQDESEAELADGNPDIVKQRGRNRELAAKLAPRDGLLCGM